MNVLPKVLRFVTPNSAPGWIGGHGGRNAYVFTSLAPVNNVWPRVEKRKEIVGEKYQSGGGVSDKSEDFFMDLTHFDCRLPCIYTA